MSWCFQVETTWVGSCSTPYNTQSLVKRHDVFRWKQHKLESVQQWTSHSHLSNVMTFSGGNNTSWKLFNNGHHTVYLSNVMMFSGGNNMNWKLFNTVQHICHDVLRWKQLFCTVLHTCDIFRWEFQAACVGSWQESIQMSYVGYRPCKINLHHSAACGAFTLGLGKGSGQQALQLHGNSVILSI